MKLKTILDANIGMTRPAKPLLTWFGNYMMEIDPPMLLGTCDARKDLPVDPVSIVRQSRPPTDRKTRLLTKFIWRGTIDRRTTKDPMT